MDHGIKNVPKSLRLPINGANIEVYTRLLLTKSLLRTAKEESRSRARTKKLKIGTYTDECVRSSTTHLGDPLYH